jgi:hypothetical protein
MRVVARMRVVLRGSVVGHPMVFVGRHLVLALEVRRPAGDVSRRP